ncbi:MAG: PEP-CTERM sorting domain-containing protein [Verrucomicrobiales bacterium]
MKTIFALSALLLAALVTPSPAAISILATSTAGTHMYMASPSSAWNTVPAGSTANIYWDADKDGVFGEAGENSGNSAATLGFTIPVPDGISSHEFAVEGFPVSGDGILQFRVIRSDNSVITVDVTEGTPTIFSDSNGATWTADFVFTPNFYGDVVSNISHIPNGVRPTDHQGLILLSLPEPGRALLLALSAVGIVLVRRRG